MKKGLKPYAFRLPICTVGAVIGTAAAGLGMMIYPNKNSANGPVAGGSPNVAAGT